MLNKAAIILVLAFSIIFAGYNAAQQYLSAVFHEQGAESVAFISLSIVYLFLAASNFVAPGICRKAGLKTSLFLSSLAYPIFIAAVSFAYWAIYPASALLGLAGAVLWTAHGTYLVNATSERDRGFYSGLSFSAVNLGSALMVFGTSFFIDAVPRSVTYGLFAGVALLGSLALLSLTAVKGDYGKSMGPFKLLKQRKALLIAPFVFAVSLGSGLMISSIPVRMVDLFGLAAMGELAGVYMFITFVSPLAVGFLIDRKGVKPFAYIAVASQLVGFSLMMSESVLAFGTGLALLAYANGSYLAAIYPILSAAFKRDLDSAVAIRMFVMSMAVVAAIASSGVVVFFAQLGAAMAISVVSIAALWAFFRTK